MKKNHKTSRELLIVATVVLGVSAILGTTASAADTENNLQIEVNISEKSIIDIQPKNFAWGQGTTTVLPGTQAGPNEEQSGYGRIQVENLGSVNITQVWLNATGPSVRPFGTGDASNYDSGNFIAIDSNNSSVSDKNAFISRVEYGLDQPAGQDIIYLDTPASWDYGRFRNTSQEYFWTFNDDEDGDGTLGDSVFRIGIDPHNSSQTGSTSLATTCANGDEAGSNTECNGYNLNNLTNGWAVTDVEVGVQDTTTGSNDGGIQYCVAIDYDSAVADSGTHPKVVFIKWEKSHPAVQQAGSGSDCGTVTEYLVGGSTSVVPGAWKTYNIRAKIPYGTVSAQLPTGSVYVLANSQ